MMSKPADETMTLDPISGPAMPQIKIDPEKGAVLGRSSQSEAVLADESVSRRHANIAFVSGTWLVTDLGSRHGTHLNGARLGENQSAPLRTGDLVGVGPWSFRVRIGGTAAVSSVAGSSGGGQRFVTAMDAPVAPGAARERVERVAERELAAAAITQNRLQLLIDVAVAVAGTGDELSLARAIVRAAAEGSGFPRAFLLRDAKGIGGLSKVDGGSGIGIPGAADELTVVSDWPEAGAAEQQPLSFSRSLINAARKGEVARLTSDAPMTAASIMSLGIQTALCVPINVGSSVGAFLYLDARAGEMAQGAGAPALAPGVIPGAAGQTKSSRAAGVYQDAAAFCRALANMYGFALSNIARQELEHRQRELVRDLEAAREAQKMIMPPEMGELGALRYAMRCKSGRYVAGDLFDVIDLGEGKVAVFLGDVAGKGISAAILMATAQTHLNVSLRAMGDAGKVVSAVNRHICKHAHSNKFISLWLGVFDTNTRMLSFVDAGHGHWVHVAPGSGGEAPKIRRVDSATGIPLGIDPDFEYQSEQLPLGPTDRLVVFSDGVVEQPGGAPGTESHLFGLERTIAALMPSAGVEQDVETLFDAVLAYALTDELADDTTVSSIQVG